MRRLRPLAVLALGALAGSVVLVAAWAIDARAHRGEVLPNAVFAGERVRGMDPDELAELVGRVSGRFEEVAVEVRTDQGDFRATVAELGASIDPDRTYLELLAVGRRGTLPGRLWTWFTSFVSPERVPAAVAVDRHQLRRVLAERDPTWEAPTEPTLAEAEGRLVARAGSDGRGADPSALTRALRLADLREDTLVVRPGRAPVPPRFPLGEAEALAATAEGLADGGVVLRAGDQTVNVPAPVFRTWAAAVPAEDRLRLGLRPTTDVAADVANLLAEAGDPAVDARFTVEGGRVRILPARAGSECCAPEAVALIDQALAAAPPGAAEVGPVVLPLRPVAPKRTEEQARALGIVEVVGTFTTSHAAGEPRVVNIQRMADMMRGTVIEPGGLLSINGLIGRRTVEKGYVDAPIIGPENRLSSDVGGGVSQFATTAFNAAFFGGYDIPEYWMHGLYISRYPYGREATLDFPALDLKVRNSTPYGMLVWTSYTSTSITVTLYSTVHAVGQQTGQTVEERPPTRVADELKEQHEQKPFKCEAVRTERTRRYVADGRTVVDYFTGLYSPAQGVRCH